jgi:uncharacterized lipoprotein YbaY/heat shock protein HslJ
MRKLPAVVCAVVALAGCQSIGGTIAEVTAPETAGDWIRDAPAGTDPLILVLDPEGRFGVIGRTVSGTWEEVADQLVLSVTRIPAPQADETRLTLREVTETTLVLEGKAPFAGSYRRSEGRVGHLDVTAVYPDKIPLPPDARVRIELLDVSRADAPATPVAAIEVAGGGLVSPMRFHLHYFKGGIDPRMTYTVAARVMIGERVWMRTTSHFPALTRGAGEAVEIRLEGVPRPGGGSGDRLEARVRRVADGGPEAERNSGLLALPATFSGHGREVSLWPDGTFRLRERVGGGPAAAYDLGRWETHGDRLFLRGRAEAPGDYRWQGGDRLQRVTPAGEPLPGEALAPAPFDPIEGPTWMVGELVYFADAAVFRECRTGRRRPVAMEGGWLAAERAYLAGRPAPGEPLLVGFVGRFVERPRMEGEGTEEVIRVEGFGGTWPGRQCDMPGDTSLRDTWWRPLVVDGRLVRLADSVRRAPHVRFLAEGRVSGSGGCNMFAGSYEADDRSLGFGGDLASTLMVCREPVQALEDAFFAAIRQTSRYVVSGDRLDLFAADGRHLAHLQATWFD